MDSARIVDRLTRHFATRTSRRSALGSALAGLTLGGLDRRATARDTTLGPQAGPAATGEPPVLQTFASGRGEVNPGAGAKAAGGTPVPRSGASFLLTLEGHTGQTICFSDRPQRIAGAMPTAPFLDTLGITPENPPNAALVAEYATGQGVVRLELIDPTYDVDTSTLVYGAEILKGYQGTTLIPVLSAEVAARLQAEFGPAALFIDSGAEMMTWATTPTGATLITTYTSSPPTQLEVCGFSEIPGAITGGDPDTGSGYTGIASLYLGSSQFSQGVWITADCVTIYPQPGVSSFPPGQYRLEIAVPPDWRVIDLANFEL